MSELEGQISLSDYLTTTDEIAVIEGEVVNVLEGDDAMASSLLRRLGAIEKQIKANAAMAQAERAKITAWELSVNEGLENSALWLRSSLEGYALHEREEFDRKTINLPFGVLKTLPTKPNWVVTDAQAFVDWAESNGMSSLVRVKKEPSMTAIKGTLEVNSNSEPVDEIGMTVPGLVVEQPLQRFTANIKPTL